MFTIILKFYKELTVSHTILILNNIGVLLSKMSEDLVPLHLLKIIYNQL